MRWPTAVGSWVIMCMCLTISCSPTKVHDQTPPQHRDVPGAARPEIPVPADAGLGDGNDAGCGAAGDCTSSTAAERGDAGDAADAGGIIDAGRTVLDEVNASAQELTALLEASASAATAIQPPPAATGSWADLVSRLGQEAQSLKQENDRFKQAQKNLKQAIAEGVRGLSGAIRFRCKTPDFDGPLSGHIIDYIRDTLNRHPYLKLVNIRGGTDNTPFASTAGQTNKSLRRDRAARFINLLKQNRTVIGGLKVKPVAASQLSGASDEAMCPCDTTCVGCQGKNVTSSECKCRTVCFSVVIVP